MITLEQVLSLRDGDKVLYTVPNVWKRKDFVIECEVYTPTEEDVFRLGLTVGTDVLQQLRDMEYGIPFFIDKFNYTNYSLPEGVE